LLSNLARLGSNVILNELELDRPNFTRAELKYTFYISAQFELDS